MTVRHLIDESHVEDDSLMDPSVVRHGTIRGEFVDALAGRVDLEPHLDPAVDHDLEPCLVVESLEVGSPVVREGDEWKWVTLDQ